MDKLDRLILDRVLSTFSAQEFRYPTLISSAVLEDSGYVSSFPQFVFFVNRLHADYDTYRKFRAALCGGSDLTRAVQEFTIDSGYALPPTVCLHTYNQMRGKYVPVDGCVITSRGKSFRYESKYRTTLERLWDFTIREIVFIGDREFVLKCRNEFMKMIMDLMVDLGMSGEVEVAHDYFFGNCEVSERIIAQRLMHLKYELRVPVGSSDSLAAASFNLHGTRFGNAFDIRLHDGSVAYTSCSGIGSERLTYAFLFHCGIDTGNWPCIMTS
ncbi:hypothetical protein [Nocardia brasiliensis]|uniref:hypothetical protein n=1 Tax=Nocardia brasiliensis TaxID=37326 RepID=UPI0024558E8F|nr:hypothetical protein [Nocardia brasiliensis]